MISVCLLGQDTLLHTCASQVLTEDANTLCRKRNAEVIHKQEERDINI